MVLRRTARLRLVPEPDAHEPQRHSALKFVRPVQRGDRRRPVCRLVYRLSSPQLPIRAIMGTDGSEMR